DYWEGPMVIKGILYPEDGKDAVRFGADGIVVSNRGGRCLISAISPVHALLSFASTFKRDFKSLLYISIRNGSDLVRSMSMSVDICMLGRTFVYALGAASGARVSNLLDLIEKEMRLAMTLNGTRSIADITTDCLVKLEKE